jgi:hypothetical protein
MVCYHIDDEYSFADDEAPLSVEECALIRRSDHVFIHSPALLEKKGRINPNTTMIPNGVEFEVFSRLAPEPADLASIPRPRIGYTGHVKKHLDLSLLHALAEAHAEWSFVFVGGFESHPEIAEPARKLFELPNVHRLGSKPSTEIAAYPQHFDVCIMPYRLMGYNDYIHPLKLHEYLATGRPTVGTPIRTLRDFADVVALPLDVDDWSQDVARALSPEENTPERCEYRRSIARRYDWNELVQRIASTIVDGLARKQSSGECRSVTAGARPDAAFARW